MRKRSLNVLHTIHDFLPRHRAGSEIYTLNLCQELQNRCHVTAFCADYDQARTRGNLMWQLHDGVPVVDLANIWPFRTLVETRSTGFRAAVTCEEAAITDRLDTLRLPRFEVPADLPEPFDVWLENRVAG